MSTSARGRVLCYGVVGVDQIVQIAGLPERDGHTRVFFDEEYIGGEAANTAVTLSCLGVDVALMGNALGEDRRGGFFLQAIRRYGVDTRHLDIDAGVRTGSAIVLSDASGERSICGHFPDLRSRTLALHDFDGVSLLSVDPFLGDNAVKAARLACDRGVTVFAVEVSAGHPLARHCDVVINSAGFLRRHNMGSPSDVAVGLLKAGVKTVVITQGEKGCRVFQESGHSFDQAAFPVAARETTGAGDAFRAGLIFGYLSGWTLTRSVQFATGCAAITCTRPGGSGHVQNEAQVLRLFAET